MLASLEESYTPSPEMAESTALYKCPDQTIAVDLDIASCSLVKILPQSPAESLCACSPGGWMATDHRAVHSEQKFQSLEHGICSMPSCALPP